MIRFATDRLAVLTIRTRGLLGKLTGVVLGAGFLWWVAAHVGPQTGRAIVHVTESDVVVDVGGNTFRVGDDYVGPLVCELPAGEHRLTMTRGTSILYTEVFTIRGGEEWILTAWDPSRRGPIENPGTLSARPRLAASAERESASGAEDGLPVGSPASSLSSKPPRSGF